MNTQLIKQDCRGRTWRSAVVRRKFIEEFRAVGESAADFCAERGIKLNTFYNWLAKERKVAPAPAFQEVQVPSPVSNRDVRVCLPNRVEVCIPVDSSAELAFVLREAARC